MPNPKTSTTLPAEADVVVVGAGAVGLCAAYYLARSGREVLVLDRGTMQDGTSWGNAGFIAPSHVVPISAPGMFVSSFASMIKRKGPVTWRPSWHPAYLRWMFDLLRHCTTGNVEAAGPLLADLGNLSARLFPHLLSDENIECAYNPTGLLNVYGDERAFVRAQRHLEWERKFGVEVEVVNPDRARELEPCLNHTVAGGFYYPHDAGLDPAQFLNGLLEALAAQKVSLGRSVEVVDVEKGGKRIKRLHTSKGDIRLQELVVAAGVWTPKLAAQLGNRIPIQPARGHSLTVESPKNGPRLRMLLGEMHVAVAPMAGTLRFSGWFEIGQSATTPSLSRLKRVESNVRCRVNLPPVLNVKRRWAGMRPVTPDGVPVIGRAPGWENVTYAAGHALLGISHSAATGLLVSQILAGQPTEIDIKGVSPERFR